MQLLSREVFLNEEITDSNLTEKDLDFWFAKLKKEHPRSYYYDKIRDLVYSIKVEKEEKSSGSSFNSLFGENIGTREFVYRHEFFNKGSHEDQWGFRFIDSLVEKGFLKSRNNGRKNSNNKIEFFDLKTELL